MPLVDSHCHLDVAAFDADRDQVVARARAADVDQQIVPAIAAEGWPTLERTCASAPGLHPAYGLHPLFLDRHVNGDIDRLERWLADHRAVAIGECGLDHFVAGLDAGRQQHLFEAQLAIARDTGLPVIVHARKAVEAMIRSVRRFPGVRGVVHSYGGSAEQARQLHDLGFLVGFGGPVTYERARRLRQLASDLPLQQLLLETDAPDQPDADHRGRRNEPARLTRVLEAIATLRGQSREALAEATTANARCLFALPAPI